MDRHCRNDRWPIVVCTMGNGHLALASATDNICDLSCCIILHRQKNVADRNQDSDEPLLNQRTQGLIGRKATLEEPIENGRGRIKLDDTLWVIEGPELNAGDTIEIISANSNRLAVKQA